MSKNALSFFLREATKEAHMNFQTEQYWRQDIGAHSIRAVAASLNEKPFPPSSHRGSYMEGD